MKNNIIKRFINLFRDINNQDNGFLGLKGHYFALDKQKHVALGLAIFLVCLIFKDSEKSLLVVFFVALAKEINDTFGIVKYFLKDSRKTMFNFLDIITTVFLPTLVHLILIN